MMEDGETPSGALAVTLDEAKAYLRIAHNDEDALLAGLIRTATAVCEGFTGQVLLDRRAVHRVAASGGWQRLPLTPVRSIEDVADADGASLAVDGYAMDIDGNGDGWIRCTGVPAGGLMNVAYRAGMAADWNDVPEPLRQGIVRLVAHMHLYRDGGDDRPPAAVAALWRPWRRMRLS